MTTALSTLLLGFGNAARGDDGIGVHAIGYLNDKPIALPGARFLDGGTSIFELLEHVEGCERLIVIDAAEFEAAPGTVRCFIDEEMDHQLGQARRTVHEVALRDLLDMARLRDALPRRRALIGVQPRVVGWSTESSPEILAALPLIRERVLELGRIWTA
jgi:hydrogenase maturation protease